MTGVWAGMTLTSLVISVMAAVGVNFEGLEVLAVEGSDVQIKGWSLRVLCEHERSMPAFFRLEVQDSFADLSLSGQI